jgi:hypothetical protein
MPSVHSATGFYKTGVKKSVKKSRRQPTGWSAVPGRNGEIVLTFRPARGVPHWGEDASTPC